MEVELSEEHQMIKDLVARFVTDELIPLESAVLERDANGQGMIIAADELERIDAKSKALGLWGLDAPEEFGGVDLPMVALMGVNEEMGKTVVPYVLPPESPNLRMLVATCNDKQKATYLAPYAAGVTHSAIAISEPGAGADPAAMSTRAVLEGDEWVINGRKIWTSKAEESDFTIVMAVTDKDKGARGGISAFLVDKGTKGFNILRKIPMVGGLYTYEIAFEDCRIPADNLLGTEGNGFAPMQLRLSTRRLQMVSRCVGIAQRCMDMVIEYAPQRETFGAPLSERQTIQWWVADAATQIYACRLMAHDIAKKIDAGKSVRTEVSMAKVYATEMAWDFVDKAAQVFGAMGQTKEMPFHLFAGNLRAMRIYEGPSEVHRWVVARDLMGLKR